MKRLMQQRGAAVLEVLLLATVIVILGYVAVTAYQRRHNQTAAVPAAGTGSSAISSSPDGSVDSVVNAVSSGTAADNASSASLDGESGQITASSGAATNIGGSYNENSY